MLNTSTAAPYLTTCKPRISLLFAGLGPTLEFYTLLSHDLQRKSLGMWRDAGAPPPPPPQSQQEQEQQVSGHQRRMISGPGPMTGELPTTTAPHHRAQDDEDIALELANAPYGLFPEPLPPAERGEACRPVQHFKLLGRVVAKALQDSRLLDLPASPVFYKLVLGRKVDARDIKHFDAELGTTLERLLAACVARELQGGRGPALIDGCPVEDLCLTFSLPGRPDYELRAGGVDMIVGSDNLRDYVDAVVDATLGSGVQVQIAAFREGFTSVFPLEALQPFYEDEVEAMLCGTGEEWTVTGLEGVIKFDHGYTVQSAPARALLEVLASLGLVDQRRFLRFVTGTPRLPPGGLAALQPRLTVVRKLSHVPSVTTEALLSVSAGGDSLGAAPGSLPLQAPRNPADGDLPSVMTCANYIKLPPYSSKEVLRERLLFAVREGQGSFDLS
jgi:E3 ubiquitin-protein ligase TRIP12